MIETRLWSTPHNKGDGGDGGDDEIIKVFLINYTFFIPMMSIMLKVLLLLYISLLVYSADKNKPHTHKGVLVAYDNKHISYKITLEQNKKLNAGEPVTINVRDGASGRGIVIQDVQATPDIVMGRIRDLKNYPKMVAAVKSLDIYSSETFKNGTVQEGAQFKVGVSLMSFTYFLKLTYEPKYHTLTWTLDYSKYSDFDDNTGHWQVVPHPTKQGWSRVLYSTEVKLFAWIPEFVITFLTKTALMEANAWVKRESEKLAKEKGPNYVPEKLLLPDVKACFVEDKNGARYETHCSMGLKRGKSEF